PSLVANSFMTRAFSSAVIDIGVLLVRGFRAQAGMSSRQGPMEESPHKAEAMRADKGKSP
ncbi:MAG: hypothetical protein VX201_18870, partial [Pseudomonadota bacterium]|nr:hypothetical protein [Pseudomonadota bacterium]